MNDTPTPRTQSLWMEHVHFANEEEAEEALADFRDLCAKLERENSAARDALSLADAILAKIPAKTVASAARRAAIKHTGNAPLAYIAGVLAGNHATP